MQCPKCHHDNRTERRFCVECGAALAMRCTASSIAAANSVAGSTELAVKVEVDELAAPVAALEEHNRAMDDAVKSTHPGA